MSRARLNDNAKCLSRQYSSQKTLLRSSLTSVLVSEKLSCSRLQEHKGFAHGDTRAEQRSSSLLSSRENARRTALFHHLKQSLLKSPPETAMDSRMKVRTSSITPAGSFFAVVSGCADENWKPGCGWSLSTRRPPGQKSASHSKTSRGEGDTVPCILRQRSGSLSVMSAVQISYNALQILDLEPGTCSKTMSAV